jgi:hypothetical protein
MNHRLGEHRHTSAKETIFKHYLCGSQGRPTILRVLHGHKCVKRKYGILEGRNIVYLQTTQALPLFNGYDDLFCKGSTGGQVEHVCSGFMRYFSAVVDDSASGDE